MSPSPTQEYRLSLRPANVAAVLLLCGLAAGWQICHLGGRVWFADGPPIQPERIAVASELINPNTATAGSLQRLPGIGAVLAQTIVADRSAHGPFRTLEDLQRVRGIGPGTAGRIGEYLCLPRRN
jgi:competence ComEA-like helix-hairpin-helix protein